MKKILAVVLILGLVLVGCKGDKGVSIEETAVDFVTDLSNAEYKKAVDDYEYSDEMKAAVNEELLKDSIWKPFTVTYGNFTGIGDTSSQKQQGYDIIGVEVNFEKAVITLNIVFDADRRIAGINCGKVEETNQENGIGQEVSFGRQEWELPGTLTIPENGQDIPALILVHGSGPNDRDETIGPNKPFRDIANGLAEKGIATLRYDKRTYVHSSKLAGVYDDFTVYDETVEDAALALEYLKTVDGIDAGRIYILGHSLGGMLIPRIAEKTPDAAGYVIMAGPVTPMEDLMVEQVKYLSNLDGNLSDEENSAITSYENMRDNVKSLKKNSDLKPSDLFGIPAAYWLDLKGYAPSRQAKNISKPLFVVQGGRDYQVTAKDFGAWEESLEGMENAQFKLYEGLNHLFMEGEGSSGPQEYQTPGHVDTAFINHIADWIHDNK